ncbi:MAG: SUMF1/EgtB/PvdO family nonheme iron enzyme [Acidobacteriota bacterium]
MFTALEDIEVRQGLLQRIEEARQQTDRLFDLVRADSLYERPIAERHRIIFYLGHLEAFDWNLLQPRLANVRVFDGEFDRLFAFGIDPVGGGLPSDQPSDWPARSQVEKYRNRVRTTLDAALAATNELPQTLLHVAIEHRLMHAETLAYMLHQLPFDRKREDSQVQASPSVPLRAAMVDVPGGNATLGIAHGEHGCFGWDNEFEAVVIHVPHFAIDRYKVTNGEYLKFVDAGGYRERSLWTQEAWDWKSQEGIEAPVFWSKTGSGWRYRGMFEEIPIAIDGPVYVSHAEASAYAAWVGKRLPTEAEWHRAAYGTCEGTERQFPWGSGQPEPRHGYFDGARWDPSPVNAFPSGASAFGVEGLLTNGWEWTATPFGPFPGFQPFPFYEGYSQNFFDGLHFVLKGGSPRTERCMLRRSFRNWFQPHYQKVYAGFRCASR